MHYRGFQMNREEFNQLDIKGQVEHFNNELKQENNNFNAICKSIGISKNTVADLKSLDMNQQDEVKK